MENGFMGTIGEGLSGMNGESSTEHICTILRKVDHWWEVDVLCDDLEGWQVGEVRET